MNQAPHMLGGRYEVGELIGRGGMAEVHVGYDSRLSRRVAIKLLREDLARDPIFLARFRREAQSAAALNNATIVAVYDTGEETRVSERTGESLQIPYIIMEYVEGHTVRELLQDGTAVPINEAVEIVDGVLVALEYAHRAGIVHRDIKPGNVMLTPQGEVKVMDFGIARALADSQATMTQANAVVGTAQYLSPEQARGEVVDTRSDLYSTGCLLFELLTGQPPFSGDSAVAIAYQHVRETPRTPSSIAPDIPEALDRVILKSLAKDREQRYSDAAEMRKDLHASVRGGTVTAPSTAVWGIAGGIAPGAATAVASTVPTPTQAMDLDPSTSTHAAVPTTTQRKSKGWLWGLLAFLVVVLGVVGVYLAMNSNRGQETPTTTVPTLTGMTQQQVVAALEGAKLKPNIGDDVASDDVDEGLFVSSSPEVGAKVDEGTTVTVHLSSGPGDVTVPTVVGLSQEDARQRLEDEGLTVANVSTEDVPNKDKDTVVSTDPKAGAKVEKGKAIRLVVASGSVDVPNLVDQSVDDASKILKDLGLFMTTKEQETGDYDPGTVLKQDLSGKVPVGSTVVLTVAKEASPLPSPTQAPEPTPSDSDSPEPSDSPSPSSSPSEKEDPSQSPSPSDDGN